MVTSYNMSDLGGTTNNKEILVSIICKIMEHTSPLLRKGVNHMGVNLQ